MDSKMTVAIAERMLMIGGRDDFLTVRLGKPAEFPDGTGFYCPYQIRGRDISIDGYGGGIDSIQAIQTALSAIAVDLNYKVNTKYEGRLLWEGDENGYLGFPEP